MRSSQIHLEALGSVEHFSVFALTGDNGDNIFEFTLQRWLFEASSSGYGAAMETISLGAAAPIAPEKSAPTAA